MAEHAKTTTTTKPSPDFAETMEVATRLCQVRIHTLMAQVLGAWNAAELRDIRSRRPAVFKGRHPVTGACNVPNQN